MPFHGFGRRGSYWTLGAHVCVTCVGDGVLDVGTSPMSTETRLAE